MNESRPDQVWQDPQLAAKFLDGIRGGVPFAAAQLDIMLRVVSATGRRIERVMDLGCGDGILGRTLLDRFSAAEAVFVDFSAAMLDAVQANLENQRSCARVVEADFGTPGWLAKVEQWGPYDVIVSGFSIHHQTDDRKRQLYGEIHGLLQPGGIFLNVEHVSSTSSWSEAAFNELMIDSLFRYHERQSSGLTRDEVARQYVQREDWSANILAPLEDQCHWLRELGFVDVDCFFKALELTVFGGRRQDDPRS